VTKLSPHPNPNIPMMRYLCLLLALATSDYYVSPTFVNNRIYLAATSGTLLVLDARATDKPTVLSKLDLGQYLAASPAFADGRIYIRTKEKLYAFGVK
jgi:outer membrane protein assembly factor BamB